MTSKPYNKIQQSYHKGIQDALEKIAFGGFTNPNVAKVAAGSGKGSTGNMASNIGKLFGGGGGSKTKSPSLGRTSSLKSFSKGDEKTTFGGAMDSVSKMFSN